VANFDPSILKVIPNLNVLPPLVFKDFRCVSFVIPCCVYLLRIFAQSLWSNFTLRTSCGLYAMQNDILSMVGYSPSQDGETTMYLAIGTVHFNPILCHPLQWVEYHSKNNLQGVRIRHPLNSVHVFRLPRKFWGHREQGKQYSRHL
jgi:hypothetical protein